MYWRVRHEFTCGGGGQGARFSKINGDKADMQSMRRTAGMIGALPWQVRKFNYSPETAL